MAPYPLENNFSYHAPKSDEQKGLYEEIRGCCKHLAAYLLDNCPESRERSVALTKLEEVMFWANAAVARN